MYFFVFGINNSGTTVVSQYLAGQAGAYLPPFGNNEGQFAPGVEPVFRARPWDPDLPIDWALVRAEWDRLLAASGKTVFVEASPPMLLRVDRIREVFADGFKGMFLVASPYMQIASCVKNYTRAPLTDAALARFAGEWAFKARHQARNRRAHPDLPFLAYEDFCAQPTRVNAAFGLPVRADAMQVSGKGRHLRGAPPDQPIRDFSVRTMAFLSVPELARITALLAPHRALVEELGYRLLPEAEIAARLATDPAQRAKGETQRTAWETRAA